MDEKQFLDKVADTYDLGSASDNWRRESYILIYEKYLDPSMSILEMGCSDGYTAVKLSKLVSHVDVIDGSSKMLSKLNAKIRNENICNIDTIYSLFENMSNDKQYDVICCSYVLEHVQNPTEILIRAKEALKPNGIMLVTVPNALALSRQMAKCMGLIDDLYSLTETSHM